MNALVKKLFTSSENSSKTTLQRVETPEAVIGQNFYVKTPEAEFTDKVASWLNYLGIADLFPNIADLSEKISEVASNLRNAGDASFLGLADKATNEILIRPGDYAALLHELTHNNKTLEGKLISNEGGAFAIQIYTVGDFDGTIGLLLGSQSYSQKDKRVGRIISEASLALGRGIFDFLANHPIGDSKNSEVTLTRGLGELVDSCERGFLQSDKTATDYLVECHGITETVADYLLSITKDSKETIVRSTNQTKKEVIGSFKALASFYHINLSYTLDEAIARTEEHFEKNEALTIHKTLMEGAKEVFAKLKEYGYDSEICKTISEIMISQGASSSILYVKGIPKLLELTGQYGPRGKEILAYSLANPKFFDVLTLSDAAEGLLGLTKKEPEQVPLILKELTQYDWNHELPMDEPPNYLDVNNLHDSKREGILRVLNQDEKAKLVALAFYTCSVPKEKASKLAKPYFEVYTTSIITTFNSLTKLLEVNKHQIREVLDALKELVKTRYKQLPYSKPKQIESKTNPTQ